MNKFVFTIIFISIFNSKAQDKIETLSNGKKIILHADYTWEYQKAIQYDFDFSSIKNNGTPKFLRQGINVHKKTLVSAVEMYLQGWRYTMPTPKSSQAYWVNSDGGTTWYSGSWLDNKTNKYSEKTPKKHSDEYYYGDGQNNKGWMNGGSPSYPTRIAWLLSSRGGVKPN